jgi:outer membrane autotransporter protein
MNRIYRLVWNRALRTVQVASELTRAQNAQGATHAAGMPRSRALAIAIAGLLLSAVASPAFADCTSTNVVDCGAPGGTEGHPGRNMPGGSGNGTGGDATRRDTTGTSVVTGSSTNNGNGGNGADGVDNDGDSVVAAGGTGGNVGATGSGALGATVTGGNGQAGTSPPTSADFWAGGGGGGGAGVFVNNASSTGSVLAGAVITGGNGGRGGDINSVENGDAGGGGGGGAGVIVGAGAGNATLGIAGRLVGGQGGAGGNVGYAGGGGGGGDALLVLGAGTNIAINNGASLQGGAGGAAGIPSPLDPGTGAGGQSAGYGGGGAGANLVGAGAVLSNLGSIAGGGAGGDGVAGVGVRAWGGADVTTGGQIQGGINGNGVRADAVLFSGGGNVLTIVSGASFIGNIESISGSTNGGDTLSLNGSADGSINAGQIVGFATNSKDGSSTWTLTGTGTTGTNWTIRSGTLVGDNNSFAGSLTFNALAGTPTVQFDQSANGTFAGLISGSGNLVKTGIGTLTLSGNVSGYSGQFSLNQGAVALTGIGDMRGAEITGSNLQFDISGVADATASIAGLSGSGGVTLGTHTLVFNNAANDSFGGVIQGAGGITLNGGTQSLSGVNTYTGDTDIFSGTLKITGTGQIGQGQSALNVIGGTLDASGMTPGQTLSVSTLAGSGNVALGTTTLDIEAGNSNFLGQISGSGGLTVNGGLLTLAGTNTYTGDTLVENGGLDLVSTATAGNDSRIVLNNATYDLRGVSTNGTVSQRSLAGSGTVRLGQMTLMLDNANDSFSGVISGSGNLSVTGGREVLDGNNTFTGTTTVGSNGTLIVGDAGSSGAALAGNASVTGGTLGGNGTVHGDVTVSAGGTLAPGDTSSLGTLTVGGDLTINSGSQLDFDLAAPGPNFSTPGQGDHIVVNGNLNIDASSLNISDQGMGPGLYNLFKWGGTLQFTNGGFQPPQGMSIQVLSADKQINLIDAQGFTLNMWDANNLAGPSSMGGGSGTWSLTTANWTDTNGDALGPMSPVPGFAVFGGASGTVTVDNTDGSVSATGVQFASDGYRLAGDALTLVGQNGDAPIIRVSDGATAIIDNLIDSNLGINKTDGGTLVLNAANLYTGNTVISGGELSVSSDINLGIAADAIDFEGGTLQITGNSYHSTARNIIWGSAGGGFDIADSTNSFTVSQSLGGTGGLLKTGAGTLVLTGTNTYAGGTVVAQGTLQGNTNSLHGAIVDNATVSFVQASDGTYSGSISGSGLLIKDGNATLTLTGSNTYTGGTVVQAGGLTGNTTSLQGTIVNNGTLDFDQPTDGAFTGAIGGTGQLVKDGAGTLTLKTANTYSGGTLVNAGALQGDTGSLQGAIVDNATVAFAQSSDGTFAGAISGTGQVVKSGTGTLVLAAGNTYSGGTVVSGGTLQGDTSSLHGAIANDATLVFAQQGDGIFDGTLSGSGQLNKNGDGTLVLNGANPFSGDTEVTAGKLVIGDDTHADASLGGTVTIDSGATLGGIGSIGGLDLSGTLTPGNSIGTLTVNGNATFHPGSSYQFEVSPDGTGDRLAVTGNVSILGGTALALANNGNWAPQTQFQIVTAGGAVSGQFDSVSSSLAFLTPSLSYSANAVTLSLARNDVRFDTAAQTPNQRAVANAIDPLGMGSAVYQAVVGLDAPTARRGFDALSGEQFASTRSALIDDSRYVRDAIDRHLLGLSNEGSQATDEHGVTVWTSAWGHWGDNDGDNNAARMQANGSGLLLGADIGVGGDARLGAVVGHGQTSMRVDDRDSNAHATATDIGVYGDMSLGAFALRGGLAYAWQTIDGTRTALFGNFANTLGQHYHAHVSQGFVEGGYRFQVGEGQQLEPFVNLARVQLQTGSVREGGGAAALAVAGDSSAVNTATLGLRDTWSLAASGGLNAHASLGWQQAWGDVTPVSSMRFASGSDSFDIAGTPVARHAAVVDAGLSFAVARNVSVDASYIGRFGSDAKDQGARMSLVVQW